MRSHHRRISTQGNPIAVRQRHYSKEALAGRGQALYEFGIRQRVEPGNRSKIVAIDIETEVFEVNDNVVPATNCLLERYPAAQPWVICIHYRGPQSTMERF